MEVKYGKSGGEKLHTKVNTSFKNESAFAVLVWLVGSVWFWFLVFACLGILRQDLSVQTRLASKSELDCWD